MPKLSGIQAIELFKARLPNCRILMLSMHDSREYISASVLHGASGYILKDVSTDEIVTAIETVAAGKTYFSSGVTDVLTERRVNGSTHPLSLR
jgi:two-component system nitrate/nitrite response regulator NarL